MLRLAARPLCTLRSAAATSIAAQTGWNPLPVAAYSSLALATVRRSMPLCRSALSAPSAPAVSVPSRSFASGDDDGDGDFEPGPVMVGGLPTTEGTGEREKPAVGANLGRASKADRAALKAKQKRASKAVAEENKYARAKQEKERTKQMRAAAQRSLSDALNVDDNVADSTGAEAEARQQARELGIEAVKDDLGIDPSSINAAKPVSRTAAEAVAAAAASVVFKGKPKDDTPLNRAMQAAAALTAGGKKASPAALAAAAAEVNRLKALAALDAKIVRVNEKITATQIILLGTDGKKMAGTFTRAEALAKGKEAGLDLLQITPPHLPGPAVVKLLDYNRHVSDQARRDADTRRAQKLTVQKESKTIQLKSKIAPGDLKVKIGAMRRFLRANHPVKIIYISKNPDPIIFFPLLQQCVEALLLDGTLSDEADLSPEKHWVHLQPLSEKKRAALYPKLTEEQRARFGVAMDAHGRWSEKGRETEKEGAASAAAASAEDAEEGEGDDEAETAVPTAAASKSTASASPTTAAAASKDAAPAAAAAAPAAASKPAPIASASRANEADEDEDDEDDDDDDDEDDDDEDDDEPRQKKGGKGAQKKQKGGGKKAQQKTSYVVATPLFSQAALRAKLTQQQGGSKGK